MFFNCKRKRGVLRIKYYLTILITAFSIHSGLAQEIPDEFKKPIVYISTKNEERKYTPSGTAFFISARSKRDSAIAYTYLVTAKHVLVNSYNAPSDTIEIRINTNQGSSESRRLPLFYYGRHKNVFYNSDPSVDIAIISVALDPDRYNYKPYPSKLLFKDKNEFDASYINEGTNVFYTGMFVPYQGYKKVSPIIRFGKVAMIPEEKIKWEDEVPASLFFVETTTFGGNSGSPLFSLASPVTFNGTVMSGNSNTKLVGIIKGYYGEKRSLEFSLNNTANRIPMYTSNVGITSVIPSYLLYEILFSKELETIRSKFDELL